MTYFYFKPTNPQYFFPSGFEEYPTFLSFYNPYTIKAKIVWWFWKNVKHFRKMFKTDEIEKYVPVLLIKNQLKGNAVLAFNIGSPGKEQKITALGFQNKQYFFLKFGQSDNAKKNVLNESNILKQLVHLDFVPNIIEIVTNSDFVLLSTSILEGSRLNETTLNSAIIKLLVKINKLQVDSKICFPITPVVVFSHGDFCPWNLQKHNSNLYVFDWEMAGSYPIGFDLFTFIFQTSFLLNLNDNVEEILAKNYHFIISYFDEFNIDNWRPYLLAFSQIKFQVEFDKNNVQLYPSYKELLMYALKT